MFLVRQNINRTWRARANINWISDPRYIEDFNNNLDSISNYRVNSDLGVYGRGRHWDAGLMADSPQLADYTLSELRLPYYRSEERRVGKEGVSMVRSGWSPDH